MADRLRLPDFIIGGAPKCATSSLHSILAAHDEVGIPDAELHFFDADDPITHPDFFFFEDGDLAPFDPDDRGGPFFAAYAEQFRGFQQARLIGEDSTTYIFSEVAAGRIKRMLPEVKLIFLLRDPVDRAYSQYWHLVGSGRTSCSFERALTRHPGIVLGSTYAPHLERYFDLFGADQVKIVLFEDFVRDSQRTVDDVAGFLGLPPFTLPPKSNWSNRTSYPRFAALPLGMDRIRRQLVAGRYREHLHAQGGRGPNLGMLADKVMRRLTIRTDRRPPMREATRDYLARHLSERNRGLSVLLGRDLGQIWNGFTS